MKPIHIPALLHDHIHISDTAYSKNFQEGF